MRHLASILLISSLFTNPQTSTAQSCLPASSGTEMSINNVEAYFQNGGDMWWDFNSGRYEVPAGSGKKPFFMNSLWLTGIDENDDLHCAAVRYRTVGNDFWPGPIFTDSSGNSFTNCSPFDRHWSVKRSEIEEFIAGTAAATEAMENWPAFGNPNLSVTLNQPLAPFVDVNGDGVYDSDSGDYPSIKGDQSVFWVINDLGNIHTESGGNAFGVEVHIMAYAYQTNNVVNNTTFYDYRILNKSNENYFDFGVGFFTDGDLGNPQDDYVGCDSSRNLGYFYNGDSDDNTVGGTLGYGTDLPVAGIRMVKLPKNANGENIAMTNFGYYSNGNGPTGDPSIAQDYFNYMNGLWRDGTDWTIGGNGYDPANQNAVKTNFMFPGIPSDTSDWSECTNGNAPGDRRMIQSHSGFELNAGQQITCTMAAIFSQEDEYNGSCVDLTQFFEQTDTVQEWSDNMLCEDFALTIDAEVTNTNAQDGAIDLLLKGTISNLSYSWSNGATTMNIDALAEGTYTVTVSNENGCAKSDDFDVQPLGVQETNILADLSIYPNPSPTGIFEIRRFDQERIEVEVYDLLGEKLTSNKVSDNIINLSHLRNGIYLIEFQSGDYKQVERVIVSR